MPNTQAPVLTTMYDSDGLMVRPWKLYYQELDRSSNSSTSATGGARVSFLDFIPHRFHADIRASRYSGALVVYMQQAIDTVEAAGGGYILMPSGTYPLGNGAGLFITSRITIEGDGLASSIMTYAGAGAALTVGDDEQLQDYCNLRDFGIRLTGAGVSAICLAMYSFLFLTTTRVELTTDQIPVVNTDTVFHAAWNQTGLLLHGGTWGSLRGLVSISGTALTWVNGDKFGPWFTPGKTIVISGTTYTVATYTDTTHMSVTVAPGNTAEIEYTSFTHGFSAFYAWQDCAVRGLFKNGIKADGVTGWGAQSSKFDGGAVVWTGAIQPPAGYGYYGINALSIAALLTLVDVENWDICVRMLCPQELNVRCEGYRSAAIHVEAAQPANCTINGIHNAAVFVIGTALEVHNNSQIGDLTSANVGQTVIVERAGPNYADLTTTIVSVEGPLNCTLDDAATYYALHTYPGGSTSRFISGSAFSASAPPNMIDDTGANFSALGSPIPLQFVQNSLVGKTVFRESATMDVNAPIVFNQSGGSSGLFWKSGVYGKIFSEGVADVSTTTVDWVSGDQYDPSVYRAGLQVFINNNAFTISAWVSFIQFTLTATAGTLTGATVLLSPIESGLLNASGFVIFAGVVDKIFSNLVLQCAGNGEHQFKGAASMADPTGFLRAKIASDAIHAYMPFYFETNNSLEFLTIGGSSGIFWRNGSGDISTWVADFGGGLSLKSGLTGAGNNRNITLNSIGGTIDIQIDGTLVAQITSNGLYLPQETHSVPCKFDSDGRIYGFQIDVSSDLDVISTALSTDAIPKWDGTRFVDSSGGDFPTAPVSSVAGRTGAIVLTSADVSGLPVANTVTKANMSGGNLTLTLSYVDVPGCKVTLSAPGTYMVTGHVSFAHSGSDGPLFARLVAVVDPLGTPATTAQTDLVEGQSFSAITISQTWVYTTATTGDDIKLQAAKNSGGTPGSAINQNYTSITVLRVS